MSCPDIYAEGYAGSGKITIFKALSDYLGDNGIDVTFMAPTGSR